jgi:glycosyltransferase involved in cell wall biosynthesis
MANEKPQQILYFNSWSTAHGGSATSLLDIVRSLDRHRFEPIVVCPADGELPVRLKEIEVPVVIHSLSRLNREEGWRFLGEVPWYMRLLLQRRVALVHGNTSASRRSLLQAAKLARVPYIQHVRNGMKNPAASVGCRYAARIIVNSDDAASALRADPNLAAKTLTIYNAVDLHPYQNRDNHRQLLGAQVRPIIGFVGQIVPRKGVRRLIDAMPSVLQRFPDALVVIVGCAPADDTDYEVACRARVKDLGISANVRFMGYRRDVPAWMRTFDVFVLPSEAEPFGKVVIEAMAAGCPVVASRVGGIPEIVRGSDLGTLIDADRPDALPEAIVTFLGDRERSAAVGEAGRRHVTANFGLTSMIERLQDLYEDVLKQHRRSHAA